MPIVDPNQVELILVEDVLWVARCPVGLAIYDFPFETFFACRHPVFRPDEVTSIGRFGVTEDYRGLYDKLLREGIRLVHSPEQWALASELPRWYELLHDLTPRSVWFSKPPPVEEIEAQFQWPIFVKGSRQTSRHKAALSILRSPDDYRNAMEVFQKDRILHWQEVVCREFVPLRPVPVGNSAADVIPASFEYRTFWWRGQCVGAGPYWAAVTEYDWTEAEEQAALAVAGEAARRLALPFLVVDVAQTVEGRWIVIEVNDAQESGYAGIPPLPLWQRVVEVERGRAD